MQVVSFDPRYLEWVRAGSKTRTTRYGETVELGPARFRFESAPPVFLDARVTGIRHTGLDDLTDEDAAAENSTTPRPCRMHSATTIPGCRRMPRWPSYRSN